jgi:replicative DNA helicase
MADLKESSGIEYGADVIITLQADASKNENLKDERSVKIRIIKNRIGEMHEKDESVNFKFYAKFNYFVSSKDKSYDKNKKLKISKIKNRKLAKGAEPIRL